MSFRIILATVVTIMAGALSACSPANSEDPKPTPSATPTQAALDLVGSWHDPAENWTVHFHDDGTFSEDFQGNVDMRTGTWTILDGVVTLEGGDGNSDQGTVKGETIEFRLGTLSKLKD
ncbi:MAG: hypothetical protein E6Q27_06280 [Aeromicrobium sp.]|nr:MAG: hypothetical protein E6Q27_06280 [Aeromicrobium sp.]